MANDLWQTPTELITWVQKNFGEIAIDLCASKQNAIAEFYLDERDDFLQDSWMKTMMIEYGELAFCNPPYSNPLPFVEQCIKWSNHGYGVLMLLNCDPSTKWFSALVNTASIIMPVVGGRLAFLDANGAATTSRSACFISLRSDELESCKLDIFLLMISTQTENQKEKLDQNQKQSSF